MVLLGDEAVAVGAIDSGLSMAYGYPGTPSSEIMEYLIHQSRSDGSFVAEWCANEKTAMEEAVGVSMVGKRVLVTLKHVGLNVAADPFMNAALLSINGGLVVAVADDPGMHSSQNEQDSRYYADFAHTICLEPTNQQEVYEMTREAFDLSERYQLPVMLRLVTRIAHSRAVVRREEKRKENRLAKSTDKVGWMLLPATSRKLWDKLLDLQPELVQLSEDSPHNKLTINENFTEFGIITTGLGGNYVEENMGELGERPSQLHIGMYPLPVDKIRRLAARVERLVVVEEGYPFVERYLRGILPQDITINGKIDNIVPPSGELNPDNVRKALGLPERESITTGNTDAMVDLPPRPPQLCAGCPHKDSYNALNQALASYEEKLVTADIGCYTLGYLPPYQAIETCLCMGASVSMAKGAAEAGLHPVVGVVGDSTFLHSGVTPLIDAVASGVNMTLMILDNSTTAMTGGQETILESEKTRKLIEGVGVEPEHIRIIEPHKKYTEENVRIIKEEIEYRGVSVIVALRECIQTVKSSKKTGGDS
jgi:indolepyruvate ferredoxin oxidoreductase alpha subunit